MFLPAAGVEPKEQSERHRPSVARQSITHSKLPIADVLAYIDTGEMFFRLYRPKGLLRAIQSHGCRAWYQPCETGGYRLIVHQPKIRTLRLLDQYQREHDGKLSRFDVALDLIALPHGHDALRQWIETHAILNWRRAGSMHDEIDTLYWTYAPGRKRPNRDVVLYSDLPSKIAGGRCVHFELRFYNSGAIRAAGYTRASELVTLNPRQLFDRHVKLVDAEPARLRIIRSVVKADRIKYRSRLDRYRDVLPDRLRATLHYAQRVKDLYPARVARLQSIPINVLRAPNKLSWIT